MANHIFGNKKPRIITFSAGRPKILGYSTDNIGRHSERSNYQTTFWPFFNIDYQLITSCTRSSRLDYWPFFWSFAWRLISLPPSSTGTPRQ